MEKEALTPQQLPTKLIYFINEEKRNYKRHDILFKRLLESFFEEFIEAFFPKIHERIDFTDLTFLSEEITPKVHDDNKQILDIVVEVKDKTTEALIVIHVEPQSYVQTDFNKRMFHYFSDLHQKFDKPIIPIAIFSYDQSWDENSFAIAALDIEVLRFNYHTIHLRSLSWRSFLKQKNPVAAALLSQMNYTKEERTQVKVEFLRLLTTFQISREKQTILMSFFESYLALSEEEEEMVMKKVSEFKEAEEVFEIINPYEERGRKRGREEGREEGIEQRNIEIALEMLQKGYSVEVISDITKLSIGRIEELEQNI